MNTFYCWFNCNFYCNILQNW